MGAPQTSGDNLGDEKYKTLDKFYEIQQCAKIRMAKKKKGSGRKEKLGIQGFAVPVIIWEKKVLRMKK